jgi:hypothetical protein
MATRAISISCISATTVLARPAMMNASRKNHSAKLHRRLRLPLPCRCSSRRPARNQPRPLDSTQFRFRFPTATPRASIPTIISVRSARVRNVRRNENSRSCFARLAVPVTFEFSAHFHLESRHARHSLENLRTSPSRNHLFRIDFLFATQAFPRHSEIFPVHV